MIDFTKDVATVIYEERGFRPWPLRAADRKYFFDEWCKLNAEALLEMETWALEISWRGMTVSTKYLIEKCRYEGTAHLTGVPFFDMNGKQHLYAINNSDSALLARWLKSRHPNIRIDLRKSMYDEEVA